MQQQATMVTYALRHERTIAADPARVFAAWTTPRLLAQWSAPEGMRMPRGWNDVRVGGRWEVVLEPVPGGPAYVAGGEYREVDPPARLAFTHAWSTDAEPVETRVTVDLSADGRHTRLVLVHTGFADEWSRDGHEDGWRSCLDRLERLLS